MYSQKQDEGKEKLIFGFYLNQEGILLVGDEKRLSALIGKMSQSVRDSRHRVIFAFTAGIFDRGRCFVPSNN